MAPPPETPSPRRFVIKKPKVGRTPLAQESTRPSSQFNSTPRFNFSSTPRPTPTQQELPRATPSAVRFLNPAHKTPNHRDAIEDSSDDILQGINETEEHDIDLQYGSGEEEDDFKIEEPTLKRRRTSFSPQPDLPGPVEKEVKPSIEEGEEEEALSSSLPILSSPPAPKRPVSTTAPRFLLSTPAPTATNQLPPTETTFLKPPRFRPQDPSEKSQTQIEPLPDQFSPHRKGQKYVAGGLAAEVRDWLVNLESAIPSTALKSREDEWLVKLLVDEVSGGGRAGMNLIRGRKANEGETVDTGVLVRVILAGEGAGTGLQKGSAVIPGKMVGIKGPVWEVVIEGVTWGVGVDWKVLS